MTPVPLMRRSSAYMTSGRSVDKPTVSARSHSEGACAITTESGAGEATSFGADAAAGHVQYGERIALIS